MSDNAPNPRPAPRRKVNQSLQYRWGVVGIILAVSFFGWYIYTSGESRQLSHNKTQQNRELIICPRCGNDAQKKTKCGLCGGLGKIWVNTDIDPGPQKQPSP